MCVFMARQEQYRLPRCASITQVDTQMAPLGTDSIVNWVENNMSALWAHDQVLYDTPMPLGLSYGKLEIWLPEHLKEPELLWG